MHTSCNNINTFDSMFCMCVFVYIAVWCVIAGVCIPQCTYGGQEVSLSVSFLLLTTLNAMPVDLWVHSKPPFCLLFLKCAFWHMLQHQDFQLRRRMQGELTQVIKLTLQICYPSHHLASSNIKVFSTYGNEALEGHVTTFNL